MELSNDEKAILRLLAQRGAAGYDDLTALTGMTAAEVHERAKAAAAQLEAEGIPAPSIPAPGSAESEAPAQPPQPEPVPPVPPKAVKAPAAAPAAPKKAPEPPRDASPGPPARSRPRFALPSSGRARAALAAGIAVVVALIVVLAVSGGGDSGDTTTSASSEGTTASENTANAAANPKLTQAVLSPVDGGDAQGLATFGRVKNSLALQIEAEGLAPTAKGQSYTIWLYESPQKMLPLASTVVPKSGKIAAQVQVPTEVLAYLAKETFNQLDVSLTDEAALKASLAKATKEKKAPLYTGTDVLRGTITGPIIGAANKAKSGE
ncbi:MAG TPA: hypothetical protein VH275_06825 [Solirubrobacterales bacterium]|jgi:hypothetical protein|nr:hypothetical protein [Solirubrobacterales bacterium]